MEKYLAFKAAIEPELQRLRERNPFQWPGNFEFGGELPARGRPARLAAWQRSARRTKYGAQDEIAPDHE